MTLEAGGRQARAMPRAGGGLRTSPEGPYLLGAGGETLLGWDAGFKPALNSGCQFVPRDTW